ncbi:MAG: aldo/keto reductase [Methanomicrobia archaeon]|nr:aldo/keto reductase [Methanomicrobia archaeon]
MKYRNLGKTGLDVSEIGLGTEYLNRQPRETVVSVVRKAVESGVNYFDLVFNFPEYLDNFGAAFKGLRDKVILTHHIGSAEKNGRYRKTRKPKECEEIFLETLSRLDIDYIDVANLHFVKKEKEYNEVIAKGVLDLAVRLKEEGKARFVGISTHDVSVATKAAKSGKIDVIMIQINMANNAMLGRNEMLAACAKEGVGLVAMKPFAGGKLLQRNKTVTIAKYQTAGISLKKKISPSITPVQCISYVLSQVGVSTVVPGVKNVEELDATLTYLNATDEEKDFSALITDFKEYITGECVYCNHCLPCPSNIDIGQTIRLLDTAQRGVTKTIQAEYNTLPAKASDCIECGSCTERCPFEVDVILKMKQAVTMFD